MTHSKIPEFQQIPRTQLYSSKPTQQQCLFPWSQSDSYNFGSFSKIVKKKVKTSVQDQSRFLQQPQKTSNVIEQWRAIWKQQLLDWQQKTGVFAKNHRVALDEKIFAWPKVSVLKERLHNELLCEVHYVSMWNFNRNPNELCWNRTNCNHSELFCLKKLTKPKSPKLKRT